MERQWPLQNLYFDLLAITMGKHSEDIIHSAENLLLVEPVKVIDGIYCQELTKQRKYLMNLLRADLVKWDEEHNKGCQK